MKLFGVFKLFVLCFGVLMMIFYIELISLNLLNIDFKNKIFPPITCLSHCSNNKTRRNKVSYLIIPKDFNSSFLLNTCMKGKTITWTMYTFVKSAVFNFQNREILRRTWASLSYINGCRLAIVFVVGTTSQRNQNLLEEEIQRYGDILQINSSDGYKDVAHKTLAGMQWASENLPDDYFYSSADDDFLVSLGGVQEAIDKYRQFVAEKKWTEFPILCMYQSRIGDTPVRDKNSKYYVSHGEYIWPHWPDYCLGGMYTTSVKVASMLWEASRTQHVIKMDDVWITGILREKIGMPRQCVQTIRPTVAVHYMGFRYRDSVNLKVYITKDWNEKFKFSNGSVICRHDDL